MKQLEARMDHEIEAPLRKPAEITHVPLNGDDIKVFRLSNQTILIQLSLRIVKHGDLCAGGGEDRTLLASRSGRPQDPGACERRNQLLGQVGEA